jgi:phenylacetate-CoA ligase
VIKTLPDVLHRPVEEVRDLQDRLFRTTVDLCYRGHPYYRRQMQAAGITPADLRSLEDLPKLATTYKKDFLADPEAFRLEPLPDLPLEARTLREVMYTTGTTTGLPAPVYTTSLDYFAYLLQAARVCDMLGIGPGDVVANAFPLTPYPTGGYVRAMATAASVGASVVVTHTGRGTEGYPVHRSVDEAVRIIETHRTTVVWGISSFVRRLLIRAAEMGADWSSVRMCLVTGETTTGAMREDMRRRLLDLGSPEGRIVNRYGSTEGTTLIECTEGAGWHNPAPDQIYLETVDPETGASLASGKAGLLCITHLFRTGTVFLRYALGDVVQLERGPCPACGRTSERVVSQPVRTGDVVKIKGTLASLDAIRAGMEGIKGVDEYQVLIQKLDPGDPFSEDELLVRLAAAEERRAVVGGVVRQTVLDLIHVTPRIEFVSQDAIYDPIKDPKPQRIIDRRPRPQPGGEAGAGERT